MHRRRIIASSGRVVVALVVALLLPTAVFAHDGEVLTDGSSAVGNVFVSGGSVHVNINNLGDCPPAVTSCWVEARWYDKGTSPLDCCFSAISPWLTVGKGVDTVPSYCDHGNHFWELHLRLHAVGVTTETFELWGEAESYLKADGSVGYRTLGKDLYVQGEGGYKGRAGISLKMQTKTAKDAIFAETTIATSGGAWLTTNAC